MLRRISSNKGLIKTIVLVVIVLLVISYYGLNLRKLADDPNTKDNFSYVSTLVLKVWNDYLKKPATYLWKDIFIELIWEPAIENLKKMKEGEASDSFQDLAPQVPSS